MCKSGFIFAPLPIIALWIRCGNGRNLRAVLALISLDPILSKSGIIACLRKVMGGSSKYWEIEVDDNERSPVTNRMI